MSDLPDYIDLDESEVVECPICGAVTSVHNKPFRTKSSVVSHIVGSKGSHSGVGYTQALSMVSGETEDKSQDETQHEADTEPPKPQDEAGDKPEHEGVKGGLPNPETESPNEPPGESPGEPAGSEAKPEDKSGDYPGCCNDPAIQGIPTGSRFKTESGDTLITQEQDVFCDNCNAIVEDDGTVIR